jgi:hypothetical protein
MLQHLLILPTNKNRTGNQYIRAVLGTGIQYLHGFIASTALKHWVPVVSVRYLVVTGSRTLGNSVSSSFAITS